MTHLPRAARRAGATKNWRILPRDEVTPPLVAGLIAMAVGTVVLIGWGIDATTFKSVFPGSLVMKANTAVCFLLVGLGVAIVALSPNASRGRLAGLALIGSAALIGLVTLSQDLTGIDLGIDQALVHERAGALRTTAAGRMSPVTSICLVLVAMAAVSAPRARRLVLVLSGAALGLSALNVFSWMFDAAIPTFLAGYSQMAAITAVVIGALAVGVTGLLGRNSPFVMLERQSPTASLLRRVLAALVVVPLALAWLTQLGIRAGLYDTGYGTALRLVAILLLGTVGVLRWANWTNELETKRQAIELERDRFFDQSLDLLAVFGADGRFRRANRAWESTLGYPVGELIGRSHFELIHPDDLERTVHESRLHFGGGPRIVGFQNRYRHRDGSYRWLEWTSSLSPDGSIAFAVARDVTTRRRAEDRRAKRERVLASQNEALSERVFRDALTGLHNRRFFDRAVARLERRYRHLTGDQRPPVALIIFDLDHFGRVNKDYGHQAGDEVLRRFSALIEQRFRERDLVVRYGGEEFVAVLEGVGPAKALEIAESVRTAFERVLIDVGTGAPIQVTLSAGCSQLGPGGEVSSALAEADVWLSQAKRTGRNQVVGPLGDPAAEPGELSA